MAARLGRVLYWLGCAVSIFVFVGTMVFVNAEKPNASEYVFIAFCTAVPWMIGRALRMAGVTLLQGCSGPTCPGSCRGAWPGPLPSSLLSLPS
jgi:hypothetical protein